MYIDTYCDCGKTSLCCYGVIELFNHVVTDASAFPGTFRPGVMQSEAELQQ